MTRVLALVAVTAIWGWTFVVVKDAIAIFPVASFLAYRFALAAGAMAIALRRPDPRSVQVGALIGLVLAAGYLAQTVGLTLTRASDAGIVTGLFIVFTPLVDRLVFGTRIGRPATFGVAIAIPGLAFLIGGVPVEVALGDLIVMAGALAFAIHIVLLSRFSVRHDAGSLTFGQIGVAALLFAALALTPVGGGFPAPPADVLAAIVITGVLATSVAFFVQTWAQRHLAATPAAVILATEPAWAMLFGMALAGDPFPPLRALGATLLLAAPLVATVLPAAAARRAA
jgi:drug/metabolite transporter (DMT)-like permease